MALTILETNVVLDLYDHDGQRPQIKSIALDDNTRYVFARLTYKGANYDIGSDATVKLIIIRPDKVGAQIVGQTKSIEIYNDDETITTIYGPYAELDQPAIAVAGTLLGQFVITSGDQILRSRIFAVNNGEALDADEWAGDYDGYNLDELVEKVDAAVDKVDGMEADVSELKKGIETSVEKLYNLIDSAFITDTASGAAAHFVDGADNIPIKSLDVNITPVQNGSGDPSPTNIRPISGFDSVKVTRTGKNLLQCPTSGGRTNAGITWTYNPEGSVTATGTATGNSWSYTNPATVILSQGTYTASVTSPFGMVIQNLTDGGYIINGSKSQVTFTLNKRTQIGVHARVSNGTTIDATTGIQIEMGSVSTEFEPYNGNTYNISLSSAGTVYGGTLDVVSGVMTVTHGYIASYSGQTLPSAWISDRDVYAEGTRPTTGAQVVYQLATPLTYQLSAQEIKSLLGINNIWSDAGDVTAEYRADTKLYIDKRLAEVTS